jgi:hypothetical protein
MTAMFMSQIIIISILVLGLIVLVRVLCHVNNCDFAVIGRLE